MTWSATEPSICHSETASIMSQNTQAGWGETPDVPAGYVQSDVSGMSDPSWSASAATPQPLRDPKIESPMSHQNPSLSSLGTTNPASRKAIECTMCFVEGILVGFSRKSDFKKHLQNFHHTNNIWVCQYTGCSMTFDFEKAYVAHVKAYHSDMHLPPNKARVELCPQLVFACGFKGCKDRVFEASSEEEAKVLRDKYFDHVAKHFDIGDSIGHWEYYTQVQNLLRQEAVKDMWKQCVWQKSIRNSLRWQPRSSADLKRLLECRHLFDMPRLLHWAWTLGGEPYRSSNMDGPEPPSGIKRPVKRDCPLTDSKHESLMKPALLKVSFPVSQQAFLAIEPPKPTPQPTVYPPDPRSSGSFSTKSNHTSLSHATMSDQEGWPQSAHPTSPYPGPNGNQWGGGYGFATPTSETAVPHPSLSATHDAVDHPMNGMLPPSSDQIQPHTSLHHAQLQQPQQHRQMAHHQPYPLQHQHQQPPGQALHPYQHHQPQQWSAPAGMEVMSPIEAPRAYEQGGDMKPPKRTLSMPAKSMENLRQKRRDPVAGEAVPPLPGVVQSQDYGVQIRGGQLHTPGTYINEVSMSG